LRPGLTRTPMTGLVSGHGFIRAAKAHKMRRVPHPRRVFVFPARVGNLQMRPIAPLAPEGRIENSPGRVPTDRSSSVGWSAQSPQRRSPGELRHQCARAPGGRVNQLRQTSARPIAVNHKTVCPILLGADRRGHRQRIRYCFSAIHTVMCPAVIGRSRD